VRSPTKTPRHGLRAAVFRTQAESAALSIPDDFLHRSGPPGHDLITATQPPPSDLYLLACRPPQPSTHSSSRFANTGTRNQSARLTASSFAPSCPSRPSPKITFAPVARSAHQHRTRPEISIALLPHRLPAAPLAHYLPTRFRALALFDRRSPERVVRSSLPAVENLHNTGLMHRNKPGAWLQEFTRSPRQRGRARSPGDRDQAS
jgi:hypothetical protein